MGLSGSVVLNLKRSARSDLDPPPRIAGRDRREDGPGDLGHGPRALGTPVRWFRTRWLVLSKSMPVGDPRWVGRRPMWRRRTLPGTPARVAVPRGTPRSPHRVARDARGRERASSWRAWTSLWRWGVGFVPCSLRTEAAPWTSRSTTPVGTSASETSSSDPFASAGSATGRSRSNAGASIEQSSAPGTASSSSFRSNAGRQCSDERHETCCTCFERGGGSDPRSRTARRAWLRHEALDPNRGELPLATRAPLGILRAPGTPGCQVPASPITEADG
jgi:hypothetical protein